jgi:hypothetical protein
MPLTNFPNGITSFGIPVLGSGSELIPPTTGSVFYVHSGTGSASNDGRSPSSALATVDQAVNKCTANKGDVILVMTGHAETISSATSLVLDVAGVSVIGLGSGNKRPTFTFATATTAAIPVSADNISFKNCRIIGNLDNIVTAFSLTTAKYFTLDGCEFIDNSNALHFLSIVTVGTGDNAADGLTVSNNSWFGLAVAPSAFISVTGDLDFARIYNNSVVMASTDDEGHFITLTSDTLRHAEIGFNRLDVTGSTGAATGVFLTGSATDCSGFVFNNLVASLDTTTELITTAGTGLKFFNNYYTGTADASGKLWPAVDGA